MLIRKARIGDSGDIAVHAMLAMEEIVYYFTGKRDWEEGILFLKYMAEQDSNQYSWQNCWVVDNRGMIEAVAIVYDGAALASLRSPVVEEVRRRYNRDIYPEDETEAGEWYIDCIAVNPAVQGKGTGSLLLQFLIDEYALKSRITLGLLVDTDNPAARRLYLKLGFKQVGEKTLAGKKMDHLRYFP
ncbi:MAG TPA: GNAT family N-acetyltransferase [Saprospiraceae bacterium]|nr:GNAT family N-acetyltransferase [Saprospiraceae bacterium]